VVNATGPWSDQVQSLAGVSASAVRGSKGVHIAVHRSRVGNVAAVTLTAPQDGRVMFVLPAGGFAIIGTTDTFDASSPDDVRASERDVEYLITSANHYFPDAALTRNDVVSAWAGIRPLAAQRALGVDPGSASREHAIEESAPGLVRVTGGKLTTYRAMAAEVVNAVERSIGRPHAQTVTARRALPGGEIADLSAMTKEASTVVGDIVVGERFVLAYGTAWRDVWRLVELDGSLADRVIPERPYLLVELLYAVQNEMALTLGDLLIRRTPIAFETMDHGRAAAVRIVSLVRGWLGEGPAWEASALQAYEAEVLIFSVAEA
jgi:glycerol-3-phosphate dehydrogenase